MGDHHDQSHFSSAMCPVSLWDALECITIVACAELAFFAASLSQEDANKKQDFKGRQEIML